MIKKLFSVSIITLLLKVFGYLRDVTIAFTTGVSFYSDIFFFFYSIPASIRQILYGTSFNAAFVPFYKKLQMKKNQNLSHDFAISMILFAGILFSSIIFFTIIFMQEIFLFINFDFIKSHDDLVFSVSVARIILPYLLILIIGSTLIGICYSNKQFIIPTILSGVINVSIISVVLFNILYGSSENLESLFHQICIAILIGGSFELIIIFWIARKTISFRDIMKGIFTISEAMNFRLIREFFFKLLPSIGFETMHQSMRVFTLFLASFTVGGVSTFYYANIIAALPLSIFAITLSIVLIPYLSSYEDAEKTKKLELIHKGIEYGIFFGMPITLFFFFFSELIIGVIFMRGEFNQGDTSLSGEILSALSLGIPASIMFRTVIVYYYSELKISKPFMIYLISLLLNIILLIFFRKHYGVIGIGLAYSISLWSFLIFMLLHIKFYDRISIFNKSLFLFIFKYSLFAMFMVLCQIILENHLFIGDNSFISLFSIIFVGIIIYLLLSYCFDKQRLINYMSYLIK